MREHVEKALENRGTADVQGLAGDWPIDALVSGLPGLPPDSLDRRQLGGRLRLEAIPLACGRQGSDHPRGSASTSGESGHVGEVADLENGAQKYLWTGQRRVTAATESV